MKNLKKGLAVAMSLAMVATVMPTMKVDAATIGTCTGANDTHYDNLDLLDAITSIDLSEATSATKITLGTVKDKLVTEIKDGGAFDGTWEALNYFIAGREADGAWGCSTTDAEYKANKAAAQKVLDVLTLLEKVKASLDVTTLTNISAVNEQEDILDRIDEIDEMIKFYDEKEVHYTATEARTVVSNVRKLNTAKTALEKKVSSTNATGALAKLETIFGLKIETAKISDLDDAIAKLDEAEAYLEDLSATVQNNYKIKKFMVAAEAVVDYLQDAYDALEKINDIKLFGDNTAAYTAILNNLKTGTDYAVTTGDNVAETISLTASPDKYNSTVITEFEKVLKLASAFVEVDVTTSGKYVVVTEYYFGKGDLYNALASGDAEAIEKIVAAIYLTTGKTDETMEKVDELVDIIMSAKKYNDEVEDTWATLEKDFKGYLTEEEYAKVSAKYYTLKYGKVQAGWVDLGNGNWDYFNADGTVATKWVAAGTNWYYVKGGHMLRNSWVAKDSTGNVWYYVDNAGKMVSNTTIDGYAIDANGEWHK